MKNYKLTLTADIGLPILYRIANLFLRRKIQVESISFKPENDSYVFKVTLSSTDKDLETIIKQLYRIVGVQTITNS